MSIPSPPPAARATGRRAGLGPPLEPLYDRCLPSGNIVLEWNQLALNALGQARLSPVAQPAFVSRDLAIIQAAVSKPVAQKSNLDSHGRAVRGGPVVAGVFAPVGGDETVSWP